MFAGVAIFHVLQVNQGHQAVLGAHVQEHVAHHLLRFRSARPSAEGRQLILIGEVALEGAFIGADGAVQRGAFDGPPPACARRQLVIEALTAMR